MNEGVEAHSVTRAIKSLLVIYDSPYLKATGSWSLTLQGLNEFSTVERELIPQVLKVSCFYDPVCDHIYGLRACDSHLLSVGVNPADRLQ